MFESVSRFHGALDITRSRRAHPVREQDRGGGALVELSASPNLSEDGIDVLHVPLFAFGDLE